MLFRSAEAAEDIGREGFDPDRMHCEFSCDMRYEGQAYEITVPVAEGRAAPDLEPRTLRRTFDHAHERLYGQSSPREPVEIVNFRVGAVVRVDHAALPRIEPTAVPRPARSRPVLFSKTQGWIDCPIHDRGGLGAGSELVGPAIIEDQGTSVPLHPGHRAQVDGHGAILVDIRNDGHSAHSPDTLEAVR